MKHPHIPPEMVAQLLALGACMASRDRLRSAVPKEFMDGEISGVIDEMQKFVAGESTKSDTLDSFLRNQAGILRDGISAADAVMRQVKTDHQAKRLRDAIHRAGFGSRLMPEDKAAWIESVKREIADV